MKTYIKNIFEKASFIFALSSFIFVSCDQNDDLETEVIMTTTSAEQDNADTSDKPVGGNTPDLAGGSRGEWGNLWQ